MPFIFRLAGFFNSKMKRGWLLRQPRNGPWPWLRGSRGSRPFWFHCASGEFEYAKPVIRLLKESSPDIPILVTYFSASAQASIENTKEVDFAVPMPWEKSQLWQEFIDFYKPRALLIARTDTWPEMLYQAAQAHLPSLLFSATLVENSGRLRWPAKLYTQLSLRSLTQIFCVSESDAVLFKQLGFESKTRVAGDTRFDQVQARLKLNRPVKQLRALFAKGASETFKVFVAGSTWAEDEAQLLVAISALKNKIFFVLVPHEPTPNHLESLQKQLSEAGLSSALYSHEVAAPVDVIIVNQVGILAELYRQADFAFVGGSFRKSVHSVMEPLACGCPTFVGPFHLNNREAIEFQEICLDLQSKLTPRLSPVQVCSSGQELTAHLQNLLVLSRSDLEQLKVQIQLEVERRSGRSELVLKWLQGTEI
jgi:3-deoxy-D-manno-octulosonic-acid transferase